MNLKQQYIMFDGSKYNIKYNYNINYIGANLGILKPYKETWIFALEAGFNCDYSGYKISIPNSYIAHLDYSKLMIFTLTANLYYAFLATNHLDYYCSLGYGLSKVYSINDHFSISPYIIQARLGLRYNSLDKVIPHVGYKLVYMNHSRDVLRTMNFVLHNLEFGITLK